MSCNCLENIQNELRSKTNDPELQVLSILNFKTGKLKPYIQVGYRKSNKNGDLQKKVSKTFISPDYCCFCGLPYQNS